jgi:hypothetical protein
LAVCDRWLFPLGRAIDCQPLERPCAGVLFPGRKMGLSVCVVQKEDLSQGVDGADCSGGPRNSRLSPGQHFAHQRVAEFAH